MNRVRLALVVAITGGLMVAFGTVADAGSRKFTYDYRDPAPAPYLQGARHPIKCGGGRFPHPIAGGFSFSIYYGNPEQPSEQVPAAIQPVGNRKWSLHEFNYDSSGSGGPRVEVVCAKRDPEFDLRTNSVLIPPGQAASVKTRCKPSGQAVSAGWKIDGYNPSGGAEILVNESRRIGERRWRVSGANIGAAPGTLSVKLNCSKRVPKLHELSRTSEIISDEQRFSTFRCGRGKVGYSAGFVAPVNAAAGTGAYAYGLIPMISANGWSVAMAPYGGIESTEITAYTYCGADDIER